MSRGVRLLCGVALVALGSTIEHIDTPLGAVLVTVAIVLDLTCLAFRDSAWAIR